jgi:hypothetical protein
VNDNSNGNRNARKQLKDTVGQWLNRITVAARNTIKEGGSGRASAVTDRHDQISSSAAGHQQIYETLADALAQLREPEFASYDPADVRVAFELIFPGKSGPPAQEWLTWLRQRVAELSGGRTVLMDDDPPPSPHTLLFRVYYGKLTGLSTTRRIVLTPAGLEYAS